MIAAIHIAVMPLGDANSWTRNGGRRLPRHASASAAIRSRGGGGQAVSHHQAAAAVAMRSRVRWRLATRVPRTPAKCDKSHYPGAKSAKSVETAVRRGRRPVSVGNSVGGRIQCAVEHRVPLVFRSKVGRGAG